jgi:GLPGLI family protein
MVKLDNLILSSFTFFKTLLMKTLLSFCICIVLQVFNFLMAQRIIAECTINYNVTSNSIDTTEKASLENTIKTVYVKGNFSKVELKNTNYYQATVYDKTSGKASIIRELGSNKFLTQLTAEKWQQQNKIYNNGVFNTMDSSNSILGYDCKMATITFENNTIMKVFYVPTLVLSVKEYEWQFKDIPGIVLYYEVIDKKNIVSYKANNISFSPVPAKTFIIPTKGFRLL